MFRRCCLYSPPISATPATATLPITSPVPPIFLLSPLSAPSSKEARMSEPLLLAPLLESYFRRRLIKQRNATAATLASYRDALRMLILFAAARLRKKPAALALEDLDR